MAWSRFDDRFHENLKVKRAWKQAPASVGLFTMAVTYSAGNYLDGYVPAEFVESLFRRARDESTAVAALVEHGLWVESPGGWHIPAFLEFNESKADYESRIAKKAEAGRKGGQASAKQKASTCSAPAAGVGEANGNPDPYPTRPDPTTVSTDVETTDHAGAAAPVVVIPPPVRQSDEVEKACDVLAAAGAHVHDRAIVAKLATDHPTVDIVESAIRAANWARGKSVKHPFGLLRQFVEDDNAPKRGHLRAVGGGKPSEFAKAKAMTDRLMAREAADDAR